MGRRLIVKEKKVPSQRLTRIVTKEFLKDFGVHGRNAIRQVREENPAEYLRIVTKLVPKQIDVGVQHSFSDVLMQAAEEMNAAIDGECRELPNDQSVIPTCKAVGDSMTDAVLLIGEDSADDKPTE